MQLQAFVLNALRSNTYVLAPEWTAGAPAVVVDPGNVDMAPVIDFVQQTQMRVVAIWNTHAHFDHVMGVDTLRKLWHVPAYVHKADEEIWNNMPVSAKQWLGQVIDPLAPPDGYWNDGETMTLGDEEWTILHTPGHSPGGVCLIGQDFVLTGDTLFAGAIGRTDLPGSNPQDMEQSLRKLMTLSDDLVIYPGHGPQSTIGRERLTNPFLMSGM